MSKKNWKETIRTTGPVHDYPPLLNKINSNDIWNEEMVSAYVHIPFCKQVCSFCCYNETKNIYNVEMESKYVDAIKEEIEIINEIKLINNKIKCLYIGGGTPTTFSGNSLTKIISILRDKFNLDDIKQITVESNPKVTTKETIKQLVEAGVNRISFGLQSDNDKYLDMFNCSHNFNDFVCAYNLVKEEGIRDVNVDLLYRLPGQTLNEWENTVNNIIKLKPEHISIYSLGITRNTKLYFDLKNNQLPDVGDFKLEEKMRSIAKDLLTNSGYHMNTLDEFSLKNAENVYSLFNRLGQNLAFGSGATGYYNKTIYKNISNVKKYIEHVENGALPSIYGKVLNAKNRIERYMVLMPYYLGFDKKEFKELFGVDVSVIYGDLLENLLKEDYIYEKDNKYILTNKGEVFAPKVSQGFYSDELLKIMDNYKVFFEES